jgi:hypothetical protein
VGKGALPSVTEDNCSEFGSFGLAGAGSLDELARPHGEEICPNEQVHCVLVKVRSGVTGPGKSPEASE